MLIYLAGPITGLSFEGATDWREFVTDQLDDLSDGHISCLSPMRSKDLLMGETSLADTYDNNVMATQRGIMARDRFDCTRSDLVFVNMLGATRVSIGTCMEIAWADLNRIPLVLVMEETGNVHEHAMLREACPFRVTSLEEGIDVAHNILMP